MPGRRSHLVTVALIIAALALLLHVRDASDLATSVMNRRPGAVGGVLAAAEFDPSTVAAMESGSVKTSAWHSNASVVAPRPPVKETAGDAAHSPSSTGTTSSISVDALPLPYLGKPCPPGCEARGTCNRDLGQCECPLLMGGKACDVSLVPSCQRLWGLQPPIPPCQALATEQLDWRDFPVSCECLAECHALNVRVVYVDKCVNASSHRYHGGSVGWPPAKGGIGVPHPWVDPFGDGRWLRQAYTPNRRDPAKTDEELASANLQLAARLRADGEESARKGHCSGRGLLTEVMPWWRAGTRLGRFCHCFPGWYGDSCEIGLGSLRAPSAKQHCVHACSGRGVCKLNFCHCVPGTWGIDCSFGEPDRAAAQAAQREQRRLGLSEPYGWPEAAQLAPKPKLPPTSPRLRVYVYHLPPKYNVWLAAHFRRSGRWDQSYLYSLDAKMHRWMLRSPYRTQDPTEAHYFLVPAYISLAFYDFEFGLYWLSGRGHAFLRETFDYVRQTFPWYNRSKGADHLFVMTNDKGATFIRGSVPQLEKVNLITQWGWVRPHIHRRGTDIVVPPMLKVDKLISESPFMSSAADLDKYVSASSSGYEYLLSFVGSVRFHTPGCALASTDSGKVERYSMGVRQKIFRLYNQTERFFLRDLRGDSVKGKHKALDPKVYLHVLQSSKFCLAPSGMGFSTRTYESVAQGCVPLIIQDEPVSNTTVDQAFDELLPWNSFSLRLWQKDIPNLPRLLAEYPDEKWRELRRNLACAWPRILWLNPDNEAPGTQADDVRRGVATAALGSQAYLSGYDALESIMHTLGRRRSRAEGKTVSAFDWRAPASSCQKIQGRDVASTPPISSWD